MTKLALIDGYDSRRNHVYRTLASNHCHIEPFETATDLASSRFEYDGLLCHADSDWPLLVADRPSFARSAPFGALVYCEGADVGRIVSALRQGASGYLQYPFDEEAFKSAVQEHLEWVAKDRSAQVMAHFTPREKELSDHFAGGCSIDELATRLGISRRTIESHRRNMRKKLIDRYFSHQCGAVASFDDCEEASGAESPIA